MPVVVLTFRQYLGVAGTVAQDLASVHIPFLYPHNHGALKERSAAHIPEADLIPGSARTFLPHS